MSLLDTCDRVMTFDTETTGVDTENDRIVTAFIGIMDTATGTIVEEWSWLIDPGVPIPVGASDVHGVTTERAQAEGRKDIAVAVFEIAGLLDHASMLGMPVVVFNAPFDLTLLDRELRRHCGYTGFRPPAIVIDPIVIDKALDRFRKGKRTLSHVAEHYGITVKDAHDARADCVMAGRLAVSLLQHPSMDLGSFEALHEKQIEAKYEQNVSLAGYFRRRGEIDKADSVDVSPDGWPMRPWR